MTYFSQEKNPGPFKDFPWNMVAHTNINHCAPQIRRISISDGKTHPFYETDSNGQVRYDFGLLKVSTT